MTPSVPWPDRWLAWYFRRGWRGFLTQMRIAGRRTLRASCRYGPLFDLDPTEEIDSTILREGYYESEVYEALRPRLHAEAVLWDIGANIGQHAVTAAALHPGLRVCAFEPNPAAAGRLRAHAALNRVAVRVEQVALGDRGGRAELFVNVTGNSGASTQTDPTVGAPVEVAIERADRMVDRGLLPPPTVVKLDVEGAEAAVLRGFGALLAAPALQVVVFEADARAATDPSRCAAASLLRDAGFRLRLLARRESTSHLLENFAAERH